MDGLALVEGRDCCRVAAPEAGQPGGLGHSLAIALLVQAGAEDLALLVGDHRRVPAAGCAFACGHGGLGIPVADDLLKLRLLEFVAAADAVVTMGCGDACPIYPGKRYEDWELEDPEGKDLETVRRIRDDLDVRVRGLLAELIGTD